MRLTRKTMFAAVIGTIAATMALAETPHEMRVAVMKANGANMGVLGGMAQDKIPYDAAAASEAAAALAERANSDWTALFPADSLDGKRAKPEIAANWDDFMAKKTALAEASTVLAAAAGTDLDALKAAFGPVGAACGACHQAYRAAE